MRSSHPLLLVLVLSSLSTLCASPVLEVGPIYLNGVAAFANYGFRRVAPDITINASGSNGTDSVSINGTVLTGFNYPYPGVGNYVAFGDGNTNQCSGGVVGYGDICGVTIDGITGNGITGFGALSNIGGGEGFLRIFSADGTLLAQAEVISTGIVVSEQGNPNSLPPFGFNEEIELIGAPEPSTGNMGGIGIGLLICCARLQKVRNWIANRPH